MRPAPPVARTRLFNCLAEETPRLRFSGRRPLGAGFACSYSGHSHQSAAFQAPVDSRHRIPLRPPHSLRGYSCPSPQQSRQLDACASALTRHVRSSRSGIVSSSKTWNRFQWAEYRSAHLPIPAERNRFGSVSAVVDWQGLDAPLIVELFAVCFFRQNPGGCRPPVPRCRHRETPDASVRYPNQTGFAPEWPCVALVRIPPGDLRCFIAHPLWTGPTYGIAAPGVSRSPAFMRTQKCMR